MSPLSPSQPHKSATLSLNTAVIIAAAACAVGLHSTLLQCLHRALTESAGWLPAPGLRKRDVAELPTSLHRHSSSGLAGTGCAICLADFGDGESVRVLQKCGHGFHSACVDKWLLSHSAYCDIALIGGINSNVMLTVLY